MQKNRDILKNCECNDYFTKGLLLYTSEINDHWLNNRSMLILFINSFLSFFRLLYLFWGIFRPILYALCTLPVSIFLSTNHSTLYALYNLYTVFLLNNLTTLYALYTLYTVFLFNNLTTLYTLFTIFILNNLTTLYALYTLRTSLSLIHLRSEMEKYFF